MTLADILNAPVEIEFEGAAYKLREPTLLECAQYQRWLEQEARATAAAATELPEEDRRNLLRDVQADIAAKRYAWGGVVCVQSLRSFDGLAKYVSIISATPFEQAKRFLQHHLTEVAAIIAATQEEDPKKLEAVASKLGLPPNYFAKRSSNSATPPTESPPTSKPSDS